MKHVLQKKDYDCAVAAAAMLLDRPYRMVWDVANKHAKARKSSVQVGLDEVHTQALLKHFGVSSSILYPGIDLEDIRHKLDGRKAILAVVPYRTRIRPTGPDEGHAVYWDGDEVFDPSWGLGYAPNSRAVWKRLIWVIVPNTE